VSTLNILDLAATQMAQGRGDFVPTDEASE
jgi:hypothetical protein